MAEVPDLPSAAAHMHEMHNEINPCAVGNTDVPMLIEEEKTSEQKQKFSTKTVENIVKHGEATSTEKATRGVAALEECDGQEASDEDEFKSDGLEECEEDDSDGHDDSLKEVVEDLEIDISNPNTPSSRDDSGMVEDVESKDNEDGTEGKTDDQKPIRMRVLNMSDLGCCEYCGGPVKKRKLASPLRRFCSKVCAKAFKRPKKRDDGSGQESGESGAGKSEPTFKMTWSKYLKAINVKAAPDNCFKHTTLDVPGLKPGMKLEAVDRNNPPSFCVATVIRCSGHRVCIRYDGYGADSSNDIWCNFQADELHPIGWCAQNGYPLQPPKGVGSNLEDWRTFLTQTLTGALAAPQDLFKKAQEIFKPRVHGFEVGMKLEVVHPLKPSIICPATVTKSLGPYYFAITPDYQHDLPTTTMCCHSDSPGIFPVGWCYRNGIGLTFPSDYTKKTFSWDKYLSLCRATVAPSQLFKKLKAHKFKAGMKVEAVDLENPSSICVATITNIVGRVLQLFFDGQSRFQFVDVDSPDIYPIGWCHNTGHPLLTPFGIMPRDTKMTKTTESEVLVLPSFDEVMGRQQGSVTAAPPLPTAPPRKPVTIAPRANKERESSIDEKDIDMDDKSGDSDLSEDDPLGDDSTSIVSRLDIPNSSERFYHNKNLIFFNKSCCIGPLLDPEKVKALPDATPPGKVSMVIRLGLEMVAKAAQDPEKVMDLMQEGCGVRVVVRHNGKLLKKAISRVDSRPKLERYLKRFCRRLICCEYFLSLKPVGSPCPDQCKADEQGNLQGPKGLKAKRSREYFEVKHLGLEKKKRGRKRRSELMGIPGANGAPLIKKVMTDNGIPVAGPLLSSVVRPRQLAPACNLQQNGSVARPAMTSGVIPGVQTPVVRFQGPVASGPVTVVRPSSANPQIAPRPAVIAPGPAPPRLIAPSTTATLVKKEPMPGTPRTLIVSNPSSSQHVSTIITNISGQRFATSSNTAGTTITFGPPPNVTICSSSVPPPLLTRMSDTNAMVNQPSGLVSGSIVSITSSGHVHSRGPPNVVVSSAQSVITSGGTLSVSEGPVPQVGVIRAPIVIPPHIKEDGLSRPPILQPVKLPQGPRMQGRPISGSVSQSRPLDPAGNAYSPRPLYTTSGNLIRPPPLSSASSQTRLPVIRAGHPASGAITSAANQRPIMPNYQAFSQGVARTQGSSHTHVHGLLQAPKGAIRQVPHTGAGQSARTIITNGNIQAMKPGVIQTIHHSANSVVSQPRPIAAASPKHHLSNSTFVRTSTIASGPMLSRPEMDGRRFVDDDEDEGGAEHAREGGDGGMVPVAGQPEVRKKRDLWWLKKKRRKRSRLTFIKPRNKRKDVDEPGSSDMANIKHEPMEDDADLHEFGSSEKSTRGRLMNKDVVLRLAGEGEGQFLIGDETDPDWDESFERKKIKVPKKKGMGRGGSRRDGTPELSPSYTGNSPQFLLPSSSDMADNPYARRMVVNSSPGPASPGFSTESPRGMSTQKSSRGGRSASFSSSEGRGRGHSSSPYPPQSAIRSASTSNAPASSRAPVPSRPKKSIGINTSLPGCLNQRSPDLPTNPVVWSVDQVVAYIRSTDCAQYAAVFQEEEIDGPALMMLTRDALMQFTPMKLGPTLKMCSYIAQLRLRAR
ncbi:uncharacterized protein LOC116616629 isoform X2 [Nematostella vectensis]|uniref:uncharacterized protein LOC116616629 isoform X2 n=1 Tax=Nematostella vectensis TaxID=45351 RepID=UPI002076F517|nr:uncharacterized protein LOC116616629 isoform X2 [Nematostella vectensis]